MPLKMPRNKAILMPNFHVNNKKNAASMMRRFFCLFLKQLDSINQINNSLQLFERSACLASQKPPVHFQWRQSNSAC